MVQKAFGEIREKHGRLDILVNNVGMRDRRGLFEFKMDAVRRLVEPDHIGQIVAIDIENGAWEIDADEIIACARSEARNPNVQIWIVRVGSRYLRRFGANN